MKHLQPHDEIDSSASPAAPPPAALRASPARDRLAEPAVGPSDTQLLRVFRSEVLRLYAQLWGAVSGDDKRAE